jgi:hypothetical protein
MGLSLLATCRTETLEQRFIRCLQEAHRILREHRKDPEAAAERLAHYWEEHAREIRMIKEGLAGLDSERAIEAYERIQESFSRIEALIDRNESLAENDVIATILFELIP